MTLRSTNSHPNVLTGSTPQATTGFPIDDIALVTVTFESAKLVDFFSTTARLFKHVYVVDNHSSDGTAQAFGHRLPHAKVIELPCNLGFGPANNVGFKAGLEHCPTVLFLNPDCQISLDAIRVLQHTLASHPRAVIACPVVRDTHGHSHGVLQRDYRLGYGNEVIHTIPLTDASPECLPDTCVEGACLMVDTRLFQDMGAFNDELFMYCEEDDLSLRALRHGHQIVTNTRAQAVHLGGASSRNTLRIQLRKAYNAKWSKLYMVNTYIGPGQRLLEAVKTLLAAPIALLFYGILLRKKHLIKWVGWWAAALDALRMTKLFRRVI